MTKRLCLILSTIAATVGIQTGVYADSRMITVAEGQPQIATSEAVQHFSDSIEVPKGEDKLQLYLTYYDGSSKAPRFKWLRIQSSSMQYITDQQFNGKDSFTMDASGEMTWGGNQILVSGAGPKGASFQWVLQTPQPTITGVSPSSVNTGNNLTISGTNFCPSPRHDIVTIGGQSARVVSANANQIVVEVPEEIKSGATQLTLSVAGINVAAEGLNVTVAAAPYLKGLSQSFVAPGETFTIYGEGFGGGDAQVYVGQFPAQVVQKSESAITVVAPAALSNLWQVGNYLAGPYWPVKVIVGGVKARNTISIESHNV